MPPSLIESSNLQRVSDRIHAGERLDAADGAAVLECHNLAALGLWGRQVRERLLPGREMGYSVGGAVGFRAGDDPDRLCRTAALLRELGLLDLRLFAAEPAPTLSEWEHLLRELAGSSRTGALTRSLSLATIVELGRSEDVGLQDAFTRLRDAGLQVVRGDSVGPGPGLPAADWFPAQEAAHESGLPVVAGLPGGGNLSPEELIELVMRVRELQDRTGMFVAFSMSGAGVRRPGDPNVPGNDAATSFKFLRTLAACRCLLDNIPVFEGGWESPGTKIAEVAMTFGATDFGVSGVVVDAGGRPAILLPTEEMERLIRDAGYTPRRRDGLYRAAAGDSSWDRGLPTLQSSGK